MNTPSSIPRVDSFGQAAERLCRYLTGGPPASARDLALVRTRLERRCARQFPWLGDSVREIVSEAILRFYASADKIDCDKNPAAYLVAICNNVARDESHTGRAIRLEQTPDRTDLDTPEDLVLERLWSEAQVKSAMGAAAAANDDLGIRVLVAFLDLAAQLDRAPSDREVAEESGTSHVTVRRVFSQAAAYLRDPSGGWPRRTAGRTTTK